MYEYFEEILKRKGMTVSDVCRLTGINSSTISTWKKRNNVLDAKLLQKIALVLDCTIDELMGSDRLEWDSETQEIYIKRHYYEDALARKYAEFLYEHPDHKILLDASMKVDEKDLQRVREIIELFYKERFGNDD